jgi:hypothetical protein
VCIYQTLFGELYSYIQSDPYIASLFFTAVFGGMAGGGSKSRYRIIGNFCSRTLWALNEGGAISGA